MLKNIPDFFDLKLSEYVTHLPALSRAFLLGKNTNKSINFVDFISDCGMILSVRSNKKGFINMNEYFTRKEALDTILDYLENNDNVNPDKMFDDCFNEDYYIIGRPTADKALQESPWGIWGAISAIEEYEKDLDGEITTDLGDAEAVANMLEYMIGQDVWNEIKDEYKDATGTDIDDFALGYMDDDAQNKLIDIIKNYDISEEPYDDSYLD